MTGALRSLTVALLAFLPVLPAVLSARAAENATAFLKNPREAFKEARALQRPILLEFHATWCSSCELMQSTTWRDPRVRELLGRFVALSVDGERSRNLQARYAVEAYPTIVVADSRGHAVLQLLGFQDEAAMAEHLDAVLSDWDRLAALAGRAEGGGPDPEAWIELAVFARGRRAFPQAETLYRRALGRKRNLTAEQASRARLGLAEVLVDTDRCREAMRLVRDVTEPAQGLRKRCAP